MELCWDPFNSPLRVLLREFGWFESNFVIRVDVGEEERWHPFQGRAYPPFSVLTYRVIPFFVPPLASLLAYLTNYRPHPPWPRLREAHRELRVFVYFVLTFFLLYGAAIRARF